MARDGFDEADDGDYERPRRRPPARGGRERLTVPGVLLAVAGGVTLILCVISLALNALGVQNTQENFDRQVAAAQRKPPSRERDQEIKTLKALQTYVVPLAIGYTILGIVCNTVTLLGGLRMCRASGYGLSVVGAVCAVIPFSGCCCLTMPVGVWALVVLLSSDAKAAFAARGPAATRDF